MGKLKACALCGKLAIIEKWSSGGIMYMAKCSNPECQVGEEITCTKGHDLKRVIAEWNLIQEKVKKGGMEMLGLNYLWIGELGNITNYGIAEVGSGFAFVWTDGTFPQTKDELDEMGFDSANGSEYHKTLSEAIEAARECFEYLESEQLIESLEEFVKQGA